MTRASRSNRKKMKIPRPEFVAHFLHSDDGEKNFAIQYLDKFAVILGFWGACDKRFSSEIRAKSVPFSNQIF